MIFRGTWEPSSKYTAIYKDNSHNGKGNDDGTLVDGEIVAEAKKMDLKTTKMQLIFFANFNDVKIGSKDPLELLNILGTDGKRYYFP